ncbi:MAG: FAD-binding oxidoreductase [Actinomycetota bacterium]
MTTVATLPDVDELRDRVAAAETVVPVGGRTHWDVGGPAPTGVEVRAPAGIVAYDPAELTVTVGAGTTVAALAATLEQGGQESVLAPRDPAAATVGGVLAAGLSGHRRLRSGPLRDRLLEVRFVTGDGRVVKGGGPTVKNVTGYDLPRLLVGSLGTIGVIVQVTLRCQPRPRHATWAGTAADPFEVRRRCFRPSCIAWDGVATRVLLEGDPDDIAAELHAGDLAPGGGGPAWPDGSHRGRISVQPSRLGALADQVRGIDGLRWVAEIGVGTVHVAADSGAPIARARAAAEAQGGWLLREQGDGIDGFGAGVPNQQLMARIKAAFDPTGKLSPGRLPL